MLVQFLCSIDEKFLREKIEKVYGLWFGKLRDRGGEGNG
jgi:hypothetical protein